MTSPEVLKTVVEESEPLPLKIKLELERKVLQLCGHADNSAVSWLEKYNEQLHELVTNDSEIKKLAKKDIEAAAGEVKKKLDEWFGYDVAA